MAEAMVSVLLKQLKSIAAHEMEQKIRLVMGVKNEVEKIESELQTIKAVLNDAEKRQVTEEAVKLWLDKLKDASYDMDDVLDEWNTALIKSKIETEENNNAEDGPLSKKVRTMISSSYAVVNGIVHGHDIAKKIKSIVERLSGILEEKNKYNFREIQAPEHRQAQHTTSFIDVSKVYGRDNDKETIVNWLLYESTQGAHNDNCGLHVISVLGFGGLGKTTLAQFAYNDSRVKGHFKKRIWVCVSDPFDKFRVAKTIYEALTGTTRDFVSLDNLLEHICESIEGKKFLLVLDDVWTENFQDWEPLKLCLNNGHPGSKILVTTRKEKVAKVMETAYIHKLGVLSEEDSQSLFSQLAFYGRTADKERENLEELGRRIVDKCKGLPLAVKTLGSHLRFKAYKEQWQNVLDSPLWESEDVERGIFAPLLFSYYDLPSAVKRCFSYCAVFPKDQELEVDELIKLWMAQGYLNSKGSMEIEMVGQEYFDTLVMRSFFQDFKKSSKPEDDGRIKSCKMHDIVHDFAQMVASDCETKELGTDSSSKNIRHSSLVVAAHASFPISLSGIENLRTLLVLCDEYFSMDAFRVPDLLCRLACLRALDLNSSSLREVPTEVGKLIHLRYLNLAYNLDLKKLPETICNLCNLQTLILTGCRNLEELPQGMEKLIYLRHLEIFTTKSLSFLPKGIGSLTSLRTLSRFFGDGGGGGKACNLGDLENLKYLRSLFIEKLGGVRNVSEVKKSTLKNMKDLVLLELRFLGENVSEVRMDDALKLIEALEPPSNLKYLWIGGYNGSLFPDWLTASSSNLRKLKLAGCHNCKFLPPLGKLQSLESLEIWTMAEVRKVGLEFLGIEVDNGDDGTLKKDEGSTSSVVAFTKLKELIFWDLRNWENWDEIPREVVVMPSLRSLTIGYCFKLKTLPRDYFQSTELQDLDIRNTPIKEYWTKRYLTSQTSKSMASTSSRRVAND